MKSKKNPKPSIPSPRPSLLPPNTYGFFSPTPDGWRMENIVRALPKGGFVAQAGLVLHIKEEAEDVYTITREINGQIVTG